MAHELAHIKRYDDVINVLQVVLENLLFYHPVVWWTSRQIRIERELCCDDLAVRACGDPVRYARALTTLARRQLIAPTSGIAATAGPLAYRVQRVLGTSPGHAGRSRWPGLLVMGVALACAALDLTWLSAQSQPAAPPAFEAASVKPNPDQTQGALRGFNYPPGRLMLLNQPLRGIITMAYGIESDRLVNAPPWTSQEGFDINAIMPAGAAGEQRMLMLRTLLADRFGLLVHT